MPGKAISSSIGDIFLQNTTAHMVQNKPAYMAQKKSYCIRKYIYIELIAKTRL
jgi:hypothetical protein